MNNKKSHLNFEEDDQKDLNKHGVKSIVPDNDEYYTLDLKRGDDTDVDDIPEIDITDKDPASDEIDGPTKSSSYYEGQVVQKDHKHPHSSNDGGSVTEDDILDQDKVSGVPGEPGGNVDSDTG